MKMAQSELLKYKYYKYDNYGDSKKQGKNTIEDLFAFFDGLLDEHTKQEVQIEVSYEFNRIILAATYPQSNLDLASADCTL